jgi:adenosine phosphosulfate reductase beta subunit
MPTFVYMTRCDGCGQCVDICPSDIMHIDPVYRRSYNIEPNFCWECYSCVKACPQHAIDVRGFADFAPLGHSVRVLREEANGSISWKIRTGRSCTSDPPRRGSSSCPPIRGARRRRPELAAARPRARGADGGAPPCRSARNGECRSELQLAISAADRELELAPTEGADQPADHQTGITP